MANAGDWMAGGSRARQAALRLVALFVGLSGIVCFAYPILSLLRDERGLIDDTRAYFGAGSAEGVPTVSQASCVEQNYGSTSSTRGFRSRSWDCSFYLQPSEPALAEAPAARKAEAAPSYEGLSYEEAMARYEAHSKQVTEENRREWERYQEEMERLPSPSDLAARRLPAYLERELPLHPGTQMPTLRRLSAEGEPLRLGIVWGGGALAWQWLSWALFSLLFLAFGGACLYAMRVAWRRTRR